MINVPRITALRPHVQIERILRLLLAISGISIKSGPFAATRWFMSRSKKSEQNAHHILDMAVSICQQHVHSADSTTAVALATTLARISQAGGGATSKHVQLFSTVNFADSMRATADARADMGLTPDVKTLVFYCHQIKGKETVFSDELSEIIDRSRLKVNDLSAILKEQKK